jgi:NADPH-dependent 2,4-dienoyl-CoA reductase/sulfur reductase-like enzyme
MFNKRSRGKSKEKLSSAFAILRLFCYSYPMENAVFDVAVIGGGPAGLAAAIAAEKARTRVLLVEREGRLGGILKQCIHDGFGLIRFGEKLSGPEYAYRYIEEFRQTSVETHLLTFATRIKKDNAGFALTLMGKNGIEEVRTKALVFATGCRERTSKQVAIHGTRPAGVLTAGAAQYYTNILGQLPARRCVVLGSGDIGLIMARRLTLEGAEVLGVYEAKSTPSGLSRNIAQCLDDFNIPLYTSRTVTRVFGRERLEAVEIAAVDEAMRPIAGTEERVECDGLILSVGLIPENELAESLAVPLDIATKGPVCDQRYMTMLDGVFCCGNALLVNDLVDYVSEIGEAAGKNAAKYSLDIADNASRTTRSLRRFANVAAGQEFLCVAPQKVDLDQINAKVPVFFRASKEREKTTVRVTAGDKEIFTRTYKQLRPPEMERISLDLTNAELAPGDEIRFEMKSA